MTASRRTLFGLPLLAGALAAGSAAAQPRRARKPKTFVLVHGGFHGGWCWKYVAEQLRREGHRVYTPTLTGLGERVHLLSPQVNLTTHIDDVANLIRWEELTDVVLCGHSYSGMVITAVADRLTPAIGSLVYIEAVIGEDGKSNQDLSVEQQPDRPPRALPRGLTMPVGDFGANPFGVAEKDAAWVKRRLTPMPVACLNETLRLTGAYRTVPRKLYITGSGAGRFRAISDRLKADPSWRTASLVGGHDLMIAAPGPLSKLLAEA